MAAPGPVTPGQSSAVMPGEVIVKLRTGQEAEAASLATTQGATHRDALWPGLERWRVDPSRDAMTLALAIARDPRVEFAQPNYRRHTQAFAPPDPKFTNQWYLATAGIDVPSAWLLSPVTPGEGVTVAVVDTGIDTSHPDLRPNLLDDPTATVSAAPWGKKFIDEVGTGQEGSDASYLWRDGNGHGTHVAGIVGAAGIPGGTVGAAPGVKLLPVKTMRADGDGDDFTIAKGLKDAADVGADVINLSVGGPAPSPVLAQAIAYDFAKGCTVVIAAGNNRTDCYYPAAYTGVIAVAALDVNKRVASYSNYGPQIALAAPGGDSPSDPKLGIYSTLPTYPCYLTAVARKPQNYGVQSGTSMATPVVSGVAALLIADAKRRGERLTPEQVRMRLIATAKSVGGKVFDLDAGFGLVSPATAILDRSHDGKTP